MLWNVSLRFIETFWNQTKQWLNNNKKNTKYKPYIKWIELTMNTLLIFYLFPPFGCLIITFYEIYNIFYDIYCGLHSFIKVEILIIYKNP